MGVNKFYLRMQWKEQYFELIKYIEDDNVVGERRGGEEKEEEKSKILENNN